MRNFNIFTIVFLILVFNGCGKKSPEEKIVHLQDTNIIDTLIFIKDTTVFSNSSEGENLSLFKNKKTNDSIIKTTVYGEIGKVDYAFIFNNQLLKANRLIYNYEEPIYLNPTPKIIKKHEENLNTSTSIKKELTDIFIEDIKLFRNVKLYTKSNKLNLLLNKWEGIYYLSPYSVDSGELGSYYLEIFKDYSDFGFSGNNGFSFEVEIIERKNKLYIYDKNKYNNLKKVNDTLLILTRIEDKNYVKSKIINIKREDIKKGKYGYLFNWKKTVEEVPDTPE